VAGRFEDRNYEVPCPTCYENKKEIDRLTAENKAHYGTTLDQQQRIDRALSALEHMNKHGMPVPNVQEAVEILRAVFSGNQK